MAVDEGVKTDADPPVPSGTTPVLAVAPGTPASLAPQLRRSSTSPPGSAPPGAAPPGAAPAPVPPTAEQRRTLGVAAAGTLLVLITYTTPLAVMPSIAAGIGAGTGTQTWLLAAVSLGLATTLMSAGALGDDYGRKKVLVGGAALLAVASVLAAAATNPATYLAGAFAQGVGGAAVLACSLGLIGHAFGEGPARARATGIWAAALGAGIGVGPLIASSLEPIASWRAAFGLAAVFSVALALSARALLVESRAADHKRVDLAGMLLLGGAVGTLIGGLVRGRSGWGDSSTLLLLGGAAILLAAFIAVEHRTTAPMLDLALFSQPRFVAVTVGAAGTGLGVIALISFMSTMVQRGLGYAPLMGAALIAVWSAGAVLTALAAPKYLSAISPRHQLAGGLAVTSVGMITMVGVEVGTNPWSLVAGLAVIGIGSGVANAAIGREAVAAVPAGRGSLGSGANNTARYVASSIGVAIVATIVASHGSGPEAIVEGWNLAVVVTTALSMLGALTVWACRPAR
ncbi:MAG: MFS transporter [Sporichthyaceae bacterium]